MLVPKRLGCFVLSDLLLSSENNMLGSRTGLNKETSRLIIISRKDEVVMSSVSL